MKAINYKGFTIEPSFCIGSDFIILKDGTCKSRKQMSKDIEYWGIYDPMENNRRHGAEKTLKDCKERINNLLKEMGMEDNTLDSWKKLEREEV